MKKQTPLTVRGILINDPRVDMDTYYAVLPLTARQARTLVRFANMTEGERIEVVAEEIFMAQSFAFSKGPWSYLSGEAREGELRKARAVLQRLGLGEGSK